MRRIAAIAVFMTVASPVALASTGDTDHEHAAHGDHGGQHAAGHAPNINWFDIGGYLKDKTSMNPPLGFAILNFVLLLLLLRKVAVPGIKGYFQGRHDTIKNALEESALLRKQAEDKLAEYSGKLASVEQEVGKLVGDIRSQAEKDKQRILDQAEEQAALLKKEAGDRIAAEVNRARRLLEREVITAAITAAETMIQQGAEDADHRKLVDEFITTVQSSGSADKETRT